jgi:hypothetical protein
MHSLFILIFSSLAVISSQSLIASHQPDCNHETLQEARERELARHH